MLNKNIIFFTLILHLLISISVALEKRIITTLKYASNRVKPVIVNGKEAYKGEVNFLVSLKIRSQPGKNEWEALCGGSIIDTDRVLTAAHCFEDNDFFYKRHPEYVRVVAGNLHNVVPHDGSTGTTNGTQWRKLSEVIIHYGFNYPMDDIALVIVHKDFDFNTEVASIGYAKRTTDYPLSCKSAGFGLLSHTGKLARPSLVLMVANIEPMTRRQCDELWGMDMSTFICSHSAVTDVAQGDSGGPMSCKGTRDSKNAQEPILVGVVSGKNFDRTTLFTRVSAYKNWIENKGSDNSFVYGYGYDYGYGLKCNSLLVAIIQLMFRYVSFILVLIGFTFNNKTTWPCWLCSSVISLWQKK